jgi:Uma2 family endonuclease
MSTADLSKPQQAVTYPDSDGQPMAENTRQFEHIVIIKCGLEAVFRARPDVFVAGDLFWYPVEGNNIIRQAPDVMVVFGRPRGHRGSYRQWEEGGVAPQVVFEILWPSNRWGEMHRKFKFYERHGVEEYYVYNPEDGELVGYERQGQELVEVVFMQDWISPRLNVRLRLVGNELELYGPDGSRFLSYLDVMAQMEQERAGKERALREAEQERAGKERALREAEQERAGKEQALREASEQKRQAEARAEELARLRARLKERGLDPDA